jgi:hypothetical protein
MNHIEVVTDIFKEEKVPLSTGLTDQNIKLNAPRLYSDKKMLYYTSRKIEHKWI